MLRYIGKKKKIIEINGMQYIWCPKCQKYLQAENFYKNKSKNGFETYCKACFLSEKKKYYIHLLDDYEKQQYEYNEKLLQFLQEHKLLRIPHNFDYIQFIEKSN
jgi:hypothetical protein